jgi:hypothetical protein
MSTAATSQRYPAHGNPIARVTSRKVSQARSTNRVITPVSPQSPPRPGPSPAPEHAATRRAPQLARHQPALDSIKIELYGDHCASKRNQTPTYDLITVPPQHHEHQIGPEPANKLPILSAGPLPHVVTLNASEHYALVSCAPFDPGMPSPAPPTPTELIDRKLAKATGVSGKRPRAVRSSPLPIAAVWSHELQIDC